MTDSLCCDDCKWSDYPEACVGCPCHAVDPRETELDRLAAVGLCCEACEAAPADVVVTVCSPLASKVKVCAPCALSGVTDGACIW